MLKILRSPLFAGFGIWFIVSILAVYIRLYPLWGHIWAPTHEWATMSVVYNIKQSYLAQIHAEFPQMSLEEASSLATGRLNETLRTEKSKVTRAIEKANETLFIQSKLPNNFYLLEADPFYFYNLTENIVTTGKMANLIKGHQYFNPLMGAPFGFWQPLSLHPYVGFVIYKIAQIFSPSIKLIEAVSFTPLMLTIFVIGGFIWCARLFSLSYPVIAISSLYFAMLPVFLKRSALGWYDTDPYNLLFTVLFLGLILKISLADNSRKILLYAGLLGLNMILFSLIWQGWIFLFFLTLISSITITGFNFFSKKQDIIKQHAYFLITFLGTTLFLGLIIYGFNGFFTFFTEGSSELGKFTNKGLNLWPNLFMEVGELQKSNLTNIMADTGGPVFLLLSFLGSLFACFHVFKNPKNPLLIKNVLLLIILLITTVLTLKANRFVIFMLIPLALFFGHALQNISEKVKHFPQAKIIGIICAVGLIGWCFIEANISIRKVLTPIFNETWDDNLTALRTLTPEDAIINTWWPPGHFVKAISHRRVMFDGASLSEDQTGYWIAKTLLSNDELEAKGILRMLNLSGNTAAAFLISKGLKTSQAVDILTSIAPQSYAMAKNALSSTLNTEDSAHLLNLTHGKMPHSYLLIYSEIIEENIGIVFVGRHNFHKIESINANKEILAQAPKPNSKEFIDYLWDLAGGPSKFSESFSLANKSESGLLFAPGLLVSTDYKNAMMKSEKYGQGTPQSIVYLKDGHITEQKLSNPTLDYSIVLYEQDHQPVCRLMDTTLANSLMMKLYFFDGKGLEHFKLIKSSVDLTGRTQIKTFQVD